MRVCGFQPVDMPIRMENTYQLCCSITIGAIRVENSASKNTPDDQRAGAAMGAGEGGVFQHRADRQQLGPEQQHQCGHHQYAQFGGMGDISGSDGWSPIKVAGGGGR